MGWVRWLRAAALVLLLVARWALADDAPPPHQPRLTKAPAVLHPVEAAYPPEMLALGGPGGQVRLLIEIGADGHVPSATVSQSSGYAAFDRSALDAIRQFEFSPAEIDGQPSAIRLEYAFTFEPHPPPPPDAPPPPPPVNLRGRALERGTRDPLPGASVSIADPPLQVDADAHGSFELRGVPAGKVKIRIEEPNHTPFETTEEIRAGEVTELTGYLWKKLDSGYSMTVRGDREKKEVSRRTLEQEEILHAPGSLGDPVRVIMDLPGVARPPYEAGLLIVRGAAPQDTGALIDGVPVPTLFHFAGGPSVVNPAFIDHVDFLPGAYGAKYGRAIAGIVDVVTKPPRSEGFHGSVGIDLIGANFFLEGPLRTDRDWGNWAIAARRSYIDALLPTIIKAFQSPGSATLIAAPRYWDYQIRYDLTRGRDAFEALIFGSDDILVLAEAGSAQTQGFSLNEHDGFHRARLKWTHKFEDGWNFSLAPTIGTTIVGGGFSSQISADIASIDFNTRAALTKTFSKTLTFETGIDLNLNHFRMSFRLQQIPNYQTFPDENPALPIVQLNQYANFGSEGLYAEVIWNPWRGLKIVPGLRFEMYELPRQSQPSVEPRVMVRYDFTPRTAIKAAWGLYREAPTPVSLESEFGNPTLGLSQSSQTVLGLEQKFTDTLSIDVQGFYNWRTRLVPDANFSNPSNIIGGDIVNDVRGRSYGVEVLLKQALTARFFGWIAYTFARSEEWDPPSHSYLPYSFDQTHILTVIGSYKFDTGIQVGLRYRYTSGRPDYPVVGVTFDADINDFNPIYGLWGAVRDPTFSQLDLRVEKLWTFERWKLSAYLDVQNVLNASNPEFVLYDYRYQQSAPLRGLPILPTLGVTGAF
jgi:TonB family protein